ncbi:MAG: ACT domain-containing protein, partial [Pseudomonadota bacterium]
LDQRMQPCLVPAGSPVGGLGGVTNMVVIEGERIGQTVYQGPGAGAGPTASAILGDVIDIARGLVIPAFGQPADRLGALPRAEDAVPASFYLRLALSDAPGTLAEVAGILGRQGVSINRMAQRDHAGETAPVIIVTHETGRPSLDAALAEIATSPVSRAAPVAIRIETV